MFRKERVNEDKPEVLMITQKQLILKLAKQRTAFLGSNILLMAGGAGRHFCTGKKEFSETEKDLIIVSNPERGCCR